MTSAHFFQLYSATLPHVSFSVTKSPNIIIINVRQTWQQKDTNRGKAFQALELKSNTDVCSAFSLVLSKALSRSSLSASICLFLLSLAGA